MSRLSASLAEGRFVVTSELTPPKGLDLALLFERAAMLRHCVDAFNVTDSHGARMAMSPVAVGHLLLDRGIEPIVQMTSRDRNRIALQADLLGAAALGMENILVMGGDPPGNGDHPQAKPVFDLFAADIVRAARALEAGTDLQGGQLAGSPRFCVGAVVNPGAPDLPAEVARMEQKLEAGAAFFQTQAVYDPAAFERFAVLAAHLKVPVLAGIILLKSAKMAAWMNDKVPGVHIPAALVDEIAGATDARRASVDIATRVIADIRGMCQGVHLMALGWEDLLPAVAGRLRAA